MAWRRTGARPLPEPIPTYCQSNQMGNITVNEEQMSENFDQNTLVIFRENA